MTVSVYACGGAVGGLQIHRGARPPRPPPPSAPLDNLAVYARCYDLARPTVPLRLRFVVPLVLQLHGCCYDSSNHDCAFLRHLCFCGMKVDGPRHFLRRSTLGRLFALFPLVGLSTDSMTNELHRCAPR